MDAHLEQHIRERAFLLWQTGAVKGGSDIDYWVAAESEVKAKFATVAAPAKPKRARATKASTPKAKSSAAKS